MASRLAVDTYRLPQKRPRRYRSNAASSAVEKALTNQDTALNATGYSNSGAATSNLAQLQSFFSLFA